MGSSFKHAALGHWNDEKIQINDDEHGEYVSKCTLCDVQPKPGSSGIGVVLLQYVSQMQIAIAVEPVGDQAPDSTEIQCRAPRQ